MKTNINEYDNRILLSVVGSSPAIITETLYALAVKSDEPWIPTEICIITTSEGAKTAKERLLEGGKIKQLIKDYDLPDIKFDESSILVATDKNNQELSDIVSIDDNEAMADFIAGVVRNKTLIDDGNVAIHASIAGGRKTMGYYLGYCMSLFGRLQDRLSHVLVSSPYETAPTFFYPTPYSQTVKNRDGNDIGDAKDAKVMLADIPFVRASTGLTKKLIQGKVSFTGAVENVQPRCQSKLITLDLDREVVSFGGIEAATTSKRVLSFLLWISSRHNTQPLITPPHNKTPSLDYGNELIAINDEYDFGLSKTLSPMRGGMTAKFWDGAKNELNDLQQGILIEDDFNIFSLKDIKPKEWGFDPEIEFEIIPIFS